MTDNEKVKEYADKLIALYVSSNEVYLTDKIKIHNKIQLNISNLFIELEKDQELFREVILLLMKHELPEVRSSAAIIAYKQNIDKENALKTIEEVAHSKSYGIAFLPAKIFLDFEANIESSKDDSSKQNNEELVLEHIEKHLGKVDDVFHEIVSDQLHIDILHINPHSDRNYHTFITNGMSTWNMNIPQRAEEQEYCELMITLPPDWSLENDIDHENNWPIKVLKQLARMPYEQNSWIGYGHTVQNGNPEVPYPNNSELSNMLVAFPISVVTADSFIRLAISEMKVINFYCLIPITKDEAKFVKKRGIDALLFYFDKNRLNDIVVNQRKSILNGTFRISYPKLKLYLLFLAFYIVASLISGILFALIMIPFVGFDWILFLFGPILCTTLTLVLYIGVKYGKNQQERTKPAFTPYWSALKK
jgi:hypothetical protein